MLNNIIGYFCFGFKLSEILGNIGFIAASFVVTPLLGKGKACVSHRCKIPIAQTAHHCNLAIGQLTNIPTILPAYANALVSFLYSTSFVNNQSGKFSLWQ